MLLGLVVLILSCFGIYGFFTNGIVLVIIAGIGCIVETLVGLYTGELKSLFTSILAIIIAVIVIGSAYPIWYRVLVGLLFENVILGIPSFLGVAIMAYKMNSK